MAKNVELLEPVGNAAANRDFMLAYQKAVLSALHHDGVLNQEQLERSAAKLEQQYKTGI